MSSDLQAAFTRFWSGATCVRERTHAGRDLRVYESAPIDGRRPSYLCEIGSQGNLEGWITLSPEGAVPRIHGFLTKKELGTFSLRHESFVGGINELVKLASLLLDYNYVFPADAGISQVFGPLPLGTREPE